MCLSFFSYLSAFTFTIRKTLQIIAGNSSATWNITQIVLGNYLGLEDNHGVIRN